MKSGQVVVLGAGSWGTALALLARGNGSRADTAAPRHVVLWARDAKHAQEMTTAGENARYLPGVSLGGIEATSDLDVVREAEWLVCAVPCTHVPDLAARVRELVGPQTVVISGTKGLHADMGMRGEELWREFGGATYERYAALSGPNLAREIVGGVPTSSVVASANPETASRARELFNSSQFRVYTNTDLVGVELGGAFKNVVAIAAGIGDALEFGDNAKAALMTRHWREMTRLAVALGARQHTLFGLSGIGDLFATCASPQSRNHRLGVALGRGDSLGEARREISQTTEGVHTTRAALALAAEHGVELPVTQQLALILFENKPVRAAIEALMTRQGRCEEEE